MKRKVVTIGITIVLVIIGVIGWALLSKIQRQKELHIVQAPDPLLSSVSEEVVQIDQEAQDIAAELKDILQELDHPLKIFGLGMAAPQLGYNKRIIGVKKSYGEYLIMMNPEVIEQKWSVPMVSTCYSLKGIHVLPRNLWMKVRYQDRSGESQEEVFKWGKATVLQQEIDHINGILLSDY